MPQLLRAFGGSRDAPLGFTPACRETGSCCYARAREHHGVVTARLDQPSIRTAPPRHTTASAFAMPARRPSAARCSRFCTPTHTRPLPHHTMRSCRPLQAACYHFARTSRQIGVHPPRRPCRLAPAGSSPFEERARPDTKKTPVVKTSGASS